MKNQILIQEAFRVYERKMTRIYHGTSQDAAKKIKDSGFKDSEHGVYGSGVYASTSRNVARRYSRDAGATMTLRQAPEPGRESDLNRFYAKKGFTPGEKPGTYVRKPTNEESD